MNLDALFEAIKTHLYEEIKNNPSLKLVSWKVSTSLFGKEVNVSLNLRELKEKENVTKEESWRNRPSQL